MRVFINKKCRGPQLAERQIGKIKLFVAKLNKNNFVRRKQPASPQPGQDLVFGRKMVNY